MKLYQAHKIFEDLHKSYAFEEAKEKAFQFIKSLNDVEDLGGDYWIQIAKEWDLNIWWKDCTSLEMTLYPCSMGEDGFFHDDEEGISITTGKTFPVDEKKLKDFLEYFENTEYYNTGISRISGSFTIAEYDGYDEDEEEPYLHILLKWGVQDGVEDTLHTEHYMISAEAFNNATSNEEIYKLLDN